MIKVASIFIAVLFLYINCTYSKKSNSRFTEEQILQLGLNNVQPIDISNEGSVKIDLGDFLSEQEVSIDELVDSITYIPLQTTHESLIKGIDKLVYVDKYVFILDEDNSNVLIYSDDGTFIKMISKGQGPQEIIRPYDIAVDEEQQHLIIYNKRGLSFYDYHGNFIKMDNMPFNFINFRVIPCGYLFITLINQNNHMEGYSDKQLLITDKKFRIISAGFPYHYSKHFNFITKDFTSSCSGKVNFAFKFSDKVYQYKDSTSAQEKFQLDFAGKGIPDKYFEMEWGEVYEILKTADYYFFMGDYAENDTHESFQILNYNRNKKYRTLVFRDKTSGKLKGGSNFSHSNNIFLFSAPFTSYKDEFISAIDGYSAYQLLSKLKKDEKNKDAYNRLNNQFGHLDEDANPILIKYKMKGFQ